MLEIIFSIIPHLIGPLLSFLQGGLTSATRYKVFKHVNESKVFFFFSILESALKEVMSSFRDLEIKHVD